MSEDALSIGGRLFSQFTETARQHVELKDSDLGNRNLVDVYLDARPSDRVRGYAQGRVIYNPTAPPTPTLLDSNRPTRAVLDQLWLKFDVQRKLFVTLGQQPIKWGSGRFWNPTDFLQTRARDPLALVDDRTGVQMLKLHVPLESLGWNFLGIVNVTGAESAADLETALRGEFVLSTVELAISAAARRQAPFRLGFDVSAGILGVDFRFEGALRHGVDDTFWRGDVDLHEEHQRLPEDYQRSDEWIAQYVVGAEIQVPYNNQDALTLGVEYFSNGLGYDTPEQYTWLLLNSAFQPLFVGREYAGFYASAVAPGSWNDTTLIMSALTNISDGSWLLRLDTRVVVFTSLTLNAFVTGHMGHRGEFRYGFEVPPQAEPEELTRGLRVRAPTMDVGIAMLLNI
jgi:hypothetical protein